MQEQKTQEGGQDNTCDAKYSQQVGTLEGPYHDQGLHRSAQFEDLKNQNSFLTLQDRSIEARERGRHSLLSIHESAV